MEEQNKKAPPAAEHPVEASSSSLDASAGMGIPEREPQGTINGLPWWKRTLDLSCILLSVPCWLLVMGAVAAWLKLVSPGPVFFRQERVGYRGRLFTLLKFRSMKVSVETESHERYLEQLIRTNSPMTKLDTLGDNRLVPGGRLLRASGLDELPQLFNVIRGEMSLVGPRPCTPNEFARYDACQQARVNVPPGLTGYWQVNGKNRTTFEEMIALDLFYTRHLSFWLDLTIIFKTGSAITAQLVEASAGRRQKCAEKISVEQ